MPAGEIVPANGYGGEANRCENMSNIYHILCFVCKLLPTPYPFKKIIHQRNFQLHARRCCGGHPDDTSGFSTYDMLMAVDALYAITLFANVSFTSVIHLTILRDEYSFECVTLVFVHVVVGTRSTF